MGKRYSDEFRAEAARLYRESDKSYRVLSKELGVSQYALRQWVSKYKDDAGTVSVSEREELKKLRSENKMLREERLILRKAAVYFAKETDSSR